MAGTCGRGDGDPAAVAVHEQVLAVGGDDEAVDGRRERFELALLQIEAEQVDGRHLRLDRTRVSLQLQ